MNAPEAHARKGAADPALRTVRLLVCERCLGGEGGECHEPGCAFWMCDAPTSPLTNDLPADAECGTSRFAACALPLGHPGICEERS